MIGTHFNHETIRRYNAVFGNLFNELTIKRYDTNPVKEISVPLMYGPGQKYIIKKNSDYSTIDQNKIRTTLPRMSFALIGMSHNPQRQGNKNIILKNDENVQYNRVPYDYIYQLQVKTKNYDDGIQIIQQICPFFTPYICVTMIDNSDLNIKTDVQLNLDSVTPQDTFEGSMDDDRELMWDLNFTLQGWMYKPTLAREVIKQVDVTMIDDYTDEELEVISAAVDPLTASETDPHTIEVSINSL